MKSEKEIINKSNIQWDYNHKEILHRKKEERNERMGEITESRCFSSWETRGGGGGGGKDKGRAGKQLGVI